MKIKFFWRCDVRIWLLVSVLFVSFTAINADAFKFPFGGEDGPSKRAKRLYREGRSAYGSANYSKTVQLATDAIKEYPEYAKAYSLRGKAKKDLGDIDNAVKDVNKALKLDPKLGEAYNIRAQVSEIMGEMDKAAADYKKACASGYREACQ